MSCEASLLTIMGCCGFLVTTFWYWHCGLIVDPIKHSQVNAPSSIFYCGETIIVSNSYANFTPSSIFYCGETIILSNSYANFTPMDAADKACRSLCFLADQFLSACERLIFLMHTLIPIYIGILLVIIFKSFD